VQAVRAVGKDDDGHGRGVLYGERIDCQTERCGGKYNE
jgi:hypothetical protein